MTPGVSQVQDTLGTDWAMRQDNHYQKVRRDSQRMIRMLMMVILFFVNFWNDEEELLEGERKAIPPGFI